MNITIKEVAKAAGVSVATVSRVLNDNANVTKETREAVMQAVEKLNYSPNFLGRNLRKCETNVILAIIPTSEQNFYSEILRGMQEKAFLLGYDVISSICHVQKKNEIRQLKMLFNRTVDGVVMFATKMTKEELDELSSNYNIALCCETVENAETLTVRIDDEKASFDAVKALIEKGHTKIGLICANFQVKSSSDRENGYRRALAEYNIPIDESYIYKNDYSFKSGSDAAEYFLNLPEPPTAIFAISDIHAMGAINKAVSLGINVGKELAIIGFDNIMFTKIFTPSVSTVSQPGYEMGSLVVEKLINNIQGGIQDKREYILPHEIILRQSTGD